MTAETGGAIVRQRTVFTGCVQGVCFRATTRELSAGHDVVGYVRNLPNGTVELEAEGPAQAVEDFRRAVERHFADNITRTEHISLPVRGDERHFEIRY